MQYSRILSATLVFANAATAQNQAAREALTRVDDIRETLMTPAGHRVKTILTKPAGHSGRLSARAVIERSGLVVLRTEKPGLYGSTGPACDQLDYNTDLATHRAALAWLRRSPHVHPDSTRLWFHIIRADDKSRAARAKSRMTPTSPSLRSIQSGALPNPIGPFFHAVAMGNLRIPMHSQYFTGTQRRTGPQCPHVC